MATKKFRMPAIHKLEPNTSVKDLLTNLKGRIIFRQSAVYRVDLSNGESVLRQRSQLVKVKS